MGHQLYEETRLRLTFTFISRPTNTDKFASKGQGWGFGFGNSVISTDRPSKIVANRLLQSSDLLRDQADDSSVGRLSSHAQSDRERTGVTNGRVER